MSCSRAEIFTGLRDAKALAAGRKNEYNHRRPHSSLGYRSPATGRMGFSTSEVGNLVAGAVAG